MQHRKLNPLTGPASPMALIMQVINGEGLREVETFVIAVLSSVVTSAVLVEAGKAKRAIRGQACGNN